MKRVFFLLLVAVAPVSLVILLWWGKEKAGTPIEEVEPEKNGQVAAALPAEVEDPLGPPESAVEPQVDRSPDLEDLSISLLAEFDVADQSWPGIERFVKDAAFNPSGLEPDLTGRREIDLALKEAQVAMEQVFGDLQGILSQAAEDKIERGNFETYPSRKKLPALDEPSLAYGSYAQLPDGNIRIVRIFAQELPQWDSLHDRELEAMRKLVHRVRDSLQKEGPR
jgi:hypothetical protein